MPHLSLFKIPSVYTCIYISLINLKHWSWFFPTQNVQCFLLIQNIVHVSQFHIQGPPVSSSFLSLILMHSNQTSGPFFTNVLSEPPENFNFLPLYIYTHALHLPLCFKLFRGNVHSHSFRSSSQLLVQIASQTAYQYMFVEQISECTPQSHCHFCPQVPHTTLSGWNALFSWL